MTMIFAAFMMALTIAFPKANAKLPAIDRCYLIGATNPGTTNIVVQGRAVEVHPLGGFVTMVEVVPGRNEIRVGDSNLVFTVAAKPAAAANSKPAVPKVYEKLPYAGDTPQPRRCFDATNMPVVVIDAGHGGDDTGALSPHNLPEKDANLRLAKAVKLELEARGVKVVMTREDDSFPALYDRPKVAFAAQADAFVSIHHNAPPLDKDPRELRYHAVYSWNAIGEQLAKAINKSMALAYGETLRDNGVIHANFAVTRNPQIPSCLIETDFITTPEGELDCWNPERRRKIATAIAEGIDRWLFRKCGE